MLLRRRCCRRSPLSIDILCPQGAQQQTRRALLQRLMNRSKTDRQTDGRTDTRPLHRPCSAYYASSGNKWQPVYLLTLAQYDPVLVSGVCLCLSIRSQSSIEAAERIQLVLAYRGFLRPMHALRKFEYLQNSDTSLSNSVPNSTVYTHAIIDICQPRASCIHPQENKIELGLLKTGEHKQKRRNFCNE